MKLKIRLMAAAAACALLCAGCTARSPMANPIADAAATLAPGTSPVLPQVKESQAQQQRTEATLYFRFGAEPYLAPETRSIQYSTGQAWELALINQLLAGPGTLNHELQGLFPDGTHCVRVSRQGRTLFVTLSREIMNDYADERDSKRTDDAWLREKQLRRKLCIQSMVATVTENCDVDQVQVLVEQGENDAVPSLRLRQIFFMDTDDETRLVGPLTRDTSLILTPEVVLRVVMTSWSAQDWERLYFYMAPDDPGNADTLLPYAEFVARMNDVPPVTAWKQSQASISGDGAWATFAVDATVLQRGGVLRGVQGRIIRLQRRGGPWKISLAQLTGWQEEP